MESFLFSIKINTSSFVFSKKSIIVLRKFYKNINIFYKKFSFILKYKVVEFKGGIIMGILNEDKLNKKDINKILSLENNITLFKIETEIVNGKKYRIIESENKNYRTLLKPYKKSLIEISKDLFKISNKNFWNKVTISGSVIHTLVDVYIANNDFSRLITIEIPCANMYSESDLSKNDYNKLLFINKELQKIVTNLTNDLEKLLDKSIKKEVADLKIDNYSLVLNYDGKKFLYKGFIPSSKTISLNLQQYDMYNLIKNKNIIRKLEKKLKDDNVFIHKNRNLKVSFDYKNDNISNLTCLPLLSLTK